MPMPDLERLGGLEWTRRTGGRLSSRERRRLLGEIVRGQAAYVASRIRLATGRLPAGARDIYAADFRPPDSAFARAAEEAAREQTPGVEGHGYRTWLFGSGLAALDRVEVDPERLYVAGLLHDHGIVHPVAEEDFTLRGAARVERCAEEIGAGGGAGTAGAEAVTAISDAITVHSTPGITVEADGALGFYVQAGAMLDLGGLRADALTKVFREEAIVRHPRAGVSAEVIAAIKAEVALNPGGRFALLRRCGFLPLIKLAPFKD
jgi:hypothetical protein